MEFTCQLCKAVTNSATNNKYCYRGYPNSGVRSPTDTSNGASIVATETTKLCWQWGKDTYAEPPSTAEEHHYVTHRVEVMFRITNNTKHNPETAICVVENKQASILRQTCCSLDNKALLQYFWTDTRQLHSTQRNGLFQMQKSIFVFVPNTKMISLGQS